MIVVLVPECLMVMDMGVDHRGSRLLVLVLVLVVVLILVVVLECLKVMCYRRWHRIPIPSIQVLIVVIRGIV